MAKRPYCRSNINELEKLFDLSKKDVNILQALKNELQHRSTHRAGMLLLKVDELLQAKRVWANNTPANQDENSSEETNTEDTITTPQDKSSNGSDHKTGGPPSQPKTAPNPRIVPDPDDIFAAWLTLEVLTPQPMPNEHELQGMGNQLVRLEEIPEPWRDQRFDKRGKERAVYWMVYLGGLDISAALKSILNIFPYDTDSERTEVSGTTTLAAVVLDAQGRPLVDKTFLSSFAWGYGKVRAGRLKELAEFVEAESTIKAQLQKRLIRQNEDSEIQSLRITDIDQAIDWLTQMLNLPAEEILRPGVAVRMPRWGWYNEAPEPELLNSFFIEDLVRVRAAVKERHIGPALSAYIGVGSTREQDVVRNKELLAKTVAPANIPPARWPGPGRHPLVLMQQAAVNHAIGELTNGGLVAINGPPGTGKTTLLRDIVAKIVLDRAIAMAQFDKPEKAFGHITSMRTSNAYTHLYQLHESLLGHEIVVASSNNKAVENISREIPSSSAVASDFEPPLRYFQSISDAVAAGNDTVIDRATWGLTAAILGNAANRSAFVNSFWWHKKRGMALYLRAITGSDVKENNNKEVKDNDGQSIPDVVAFEQPPRSEVEALQRWRIARQDFLSKLKAVKDVQKRTQAVYNAVCQKSEVIKQAEVATSLVIAAGRDLAVASEQESAARRYMQVHLMLSVRQQRIGWPLAICDRAFLRVFFGPGLIGNGAIK
jgi:hypothetical protein